MTRLIQWDSSQFPMTHLAVKIFHGDRAFQSFLVIRRSDPLRIMFHSVYPIRKTTIQQLCSDFRRRVRCMERESKFYENRRVIYTRSSLWPAKAAEILTGHTNVSFIIFHRNRQ